MDELSIGWERALLGSVLYQPSKIDLVSIVRPSDFTGCHQTLWSGMLSLAGRGLLDLRTLVEEMRSRGELETLSSFETTAQGEGYIRELLTYQGNDIRHYADEVLAQSGKRQLGVIAALIRAEADDRRLSYDEVLGKAEERIFSLRHS